MGSTSNTSHGHVQNLQIMAQYSTEPGAMSYANRQLALIERQKATAGKGVAPMSESMRLTKQMHQYEQVGNNVLSAPECKMVAFNKAASLQQQIAKCQ